MWNSSSEGTHYFSGKSEWLIMKAGPDKWGLFSRPNAQFDYSLYQIFPQPELAMRFVENVESNQTLQVFEEVRKKAKPGLGRRFSLRQSRI